MPSNGGGCSIRESRRIRRKCNDWPRRLWTRTSKAAKAQVPQDAEEQAAMPLSDTLGVVRSALCGDPRFADPCGAALYGSKACADFANEATRIHARRLAQQLERQLDQRPASS